jgi:hypothetical protein
MPTLVARGGSPLTLTTGYPTQGGQPWVAGVAGSAPGCPGVSKDFRRELLNQNHLENRRSDLPLPRPNVA